MCNSVPRRPQPTTCDGEATRWSLWVDDDPIADGDAPPTWSWVGVEHRLSAGPHTIRVAFSNDCYVPEIGVTQAKLALAGYCTVRFNFRGVGASEASAGDAGSRALRRSAKLAGLIAAPFDPSII